MTSAGSPGDRLVDFADARPGRRGDFRDGGDDGDDDRVAGDDGDADDDADEAPTRRRSQSSPSVASSSEELSF